MFKITGMLTRFMSAKRNPTEKYLAEIGSGHVSDRTRREFDAWQRDGWEAIQRGLDELVAQLPEDPGQRP